MKMMRRLSVGELAVAALLAALAIGALVLALSGCEKPEGPAERAGKQIDKAVDQTGQQIERAGEKIQDEAREAKK